MQVKSSPSTPQFHQFDPEQVLDDEHQTFSELCHTILSGLEEGKVVCVRKMGDREVLVLRKMALWERVFHRVFHWKKEELRLTTIAPLFQNIWSHHQDEVVTSESKSAIDAVIKRFSPSLFAWKTTTLQLSNNFAKLLPLQSNAEQPHVTLITSTGLKYEVPLSRLQVIPFYKNLFDACTYQQNHELKLPENIADKPLKILLDLLDGKSIDRLTLKEFDELFLLADFLAFEALERALSEALIEQFKKGDTKQKIALAPLLAKWQALSNVVAQETVRKILIHFGWRSNLIAPWLQAIMVALKEMANVDEHIYRQGLHSIELLSLCGYCGIQIDKRLLVPDSPVTASSNYYKYICHYYGMGTQKNLKTALEYCQLAAKEGFVNAQNDLGRHYASGLGVQKDLKLAVYWFQLAAEQGSISAQSNLGCAYSHGAGVEKDPELALYWFRLAAEQGNPSAQYNLGVCYSIKSDAQDLTQAAYWFRQAAQQGHVASIKTLKDLDL